jgi:sugar lactone lactonase YvrE
MKSFSIFQEIAVFAVMALTPAMAQPPVANNYATPYTFTTLAGKAGISGSTDGTGANAQFNLIGQLATDVKGNIYVADYNNQTIRKITPGGVVSTIAGKAGVSGSADGVGSNARFSGPYGVAVDYNGNVYVAEYSNHTIRKITPSGMVTTLAGKAGVSGSADGIGSNARFYYPYGIAVNTAGTVIYVADTNNNTIRKITPGGVVTTFACSAGQAGSNDGLGSSARFNFPTSVAVDLAGNVYVADFSNQTIRKISPGGAVSTLAGVAGEYGNNDGVGSNARFGNPYGIAVDLSGNVYVAEYGNQLVRKISSGGQVTTLGGLVNHDEIVDGRGSAARFYSPYGIAVDLSGNLYVADYYYTVRKGRR